MDLFDDEDFTAVLDSLEQRPAEVRRALLARNPSALADNVKDWPAFVVALPAALAAIDQASFDGVVVTGDLTRKLQAYVYYFLSQAMKDFKEEK